MERRQFLLERSGAEPRSIARVGTEPFHQSRQGGSDPCHSPTRHSRTLKFGAAAGIDRCSTSDGHHRALTGSCLESGKEIMHCLCLKCAPGRFPLLCKDSTNRMQPGPPQRMVVEIIKGPPQHLGEHGADGRLARPSHANENNPPKRRCHRSARIDATADAALAVHDLATCAGLHAGTEAHGADLLSAAGLVWVMHGGEDDSG